MPRRIEVEEGDDAVLRVLRAQDKEGRWWRVDGECVRCGDCCTPASGEFCQWRTIVDGLIFCSLQPEIMKPWNCAIVPRCPEIELPSTCGYTWTAEG